jgi:restriction endonuclease S subunit
MRSGRVDTSDPAWCDISPTKAAAIALETGDILVTKSSGSSDLVGKSCYFVQPLDGITYGFSNFILRLRPKAKVVSPEYVSWFLRSPQALSWRYETQLNAVGLRNLQTTAFLSQLVPVPPHWLQDVLVAFLNRLEARNGAWLSLPLDGLEEQRRLVERIDALAAKIEEAMRLRAESQAHLDVLANSVLSGLVSGGATSKPLADVIKPGSTISYGVLVPGSDDPSGVPFVRIQDLHPTCPPEVPSKKIAPHVDAQYARTRLQGDEVLVAVVGATIGKVGIVPPSWVGANIARAVCRIIPGPDITREFLIAVLRSQKVQDYFRETTRTLAQPTLNVGQLELTPIPVVTLDRQHQILAQLTTIESAVHSCRQLQSTTLNELDAMLPAILDRAFKGALL